MKLALAKIAAAVEVITVAVAAGDEAAIEVDTAAAVDTAADTAAVAVATGDEAAAAAEEKVKAAANRYDLKVSVPFNLQFS